jgi:hypothetical protein
MHTIFTFLQKSYLYVEVNCTERSCLHAWANATFFFTAVKLFMTPALIAAVVVSDDSPKMFHFL